MGIFSFLLQPRKKLVCLEDIIPLISISISAHVLST